MVAKIKGTQMNLLIAGLLVMALGTNAEARRYRRAHSQDPANVCQMVPPNTQAFDQDPMDHANVDQTTFNQIMDAVQAVYTPIIAARGGRLVIDRLWTNDEANAFADRPGGNVWAIHMFGGLARHPNMTPDSMLLVACHELGHHLGGAPKYTTGWNASSEGEADYYGVLKCMRLVLRHYDNVRVVQAEGAQVTPDIVQRCRSVGSDNQTLAACVRSVIAGQHLAAVLTDLENTEAAQQKGPTFAIPSLTTPDPKQVPVTLFNVYPGLQCRFDTYVAGSICPASADQSMDDRDPAVGSCYRPAAGLVVQSAGAVQFAPGARPACWFRQ